jgi:spore maturation protein CgeB
VFETVGRGGFIIHPKIPGLSRYFTDGEHLMMYDFGDFDQLKQMIDHFLLPSNQEQRNRMRHAGHLLVKNNHTYVHRWTQILETLGVG